MHKSVYFDTSRLTWKDQNKNEIRRRIACSVFLFLGGRRYYSRIKTDRNRYFFTFILHNCLTPCNRNPQLQRSHTSQTVVVSGRDNKWNSLREAALLSAPRSFSSRKTRSQDSLCFSYDECRKPSEVLADSGSELRYVVLRRRFADIACTSKSTWKLPWRNCFLHFS